MDEGGVKEEVGARPSLEIVKLWCPSLVFESLGSWSLSPGSPHWLGGLLQRPWGRPGAGFCQLGGYC